jgi:hypothetical protein
MNMFEYGVSTVNDSIVYNPSLTMVSVYTIYDVIVQINPRLRYEQTLLHYWSDCIAGQLAGR